MQFKPNSESCKRFSLLCSIVLSLSTIYRIREEERLHVEDDVNNAEYDDHVTCHFDGKRSKMGHLQGGEVKEHLPVIVSGVSGERQLGIQIAENSTGMKKKMFHFPSLSLSFYFVTSRIPFVRHFCFALLCVCICYCFDGE